MKENGKTPKTNKADIEQKTRVLLEKMESNIQKIAEAQTSHSGRLDKIETAVEDVPAIKSEVKSISMAVMQISNDVKAINTKLDENISNHEKRITKLEEKVHV